MSGRVRHATMTDATQGDAVVAMMRGLYTEDPASAPVNAERFPETIRVRMLW